MEGAFAALVIVVGIVAALIAVGTAFLSRGNPYESIGKGGLSLDTPDAEPERRPAAPEDPTAREEIRQMVEAKSAMREARGEEPLDVDAEVAKLTGPSPAEQARDEGLREEVRQLVIARNERRAARGEPPLDVDAEVERQLRDVGA
jgi:hypothetical protein